MPTFNRQLLCLLLLSGFCSGCTIPVFKHSLVDPAEAKVYSELYGAYRGSNSDKSDMFYEHVGAAGEDFPKGFLRIVQVEYLDGPSKKNNYSILIAFAEKIGSDFILQIPLQIKEEGSRNKWNFNWSGKWDKEKVAGYIFVKLKSKEEGFLMSSLNTDFLKEQIEFKKLSGKVTPIKDDSRWEKFKILVTAEPEELHAFFEKHIDGKLFGKDDPDEILKRLD